MRMHLGEAYHAGAVWRYRDARDVVHLGHYEGRHERGDASMTYYFRDCATGERTGVAGARLRAARPAPDVRCPIQDALRAACRR